MTLCVSTMNEWMKIILHVLQQGFSFILQQSWCDTFSLLTTIIVKQVLCLNLLICSGSRSHHKQTPSEILRDLTETTSLKGCVYCWFTILLQFALFRPKWENQEFASSWLNKDGLKTPSLFTTKSVWMSWSEWSSSNSDFQLSKRYKREKCFCSSAALNCSWEPHYVSFTSTGLSPSTGSEQWGFRALCADPDELCKGRTICLLPVEI